MTAFQFFKRYWPDYLMGAICLLLTNALSATIPMTVKHILENLKAQQVNQVWILLAGIAGIVILMFIVRVTSRHLLIGVGRKIEYDVRMKLFDHLLAMPKSYYDARQTGELMSRMTNDLTVLRYFLGGGMMLYINVFFAYVCILPMMVLLSWQLTILTFILYPFVMGLMRSFSLDIKNKTHEVQDALGDITTLAQENFSGISVIQSYAVEAQESKRFKDANQSYFTANLKLVKIRALLYILIAAVTGFSTLAILGEGGREAIAGSLSISSLAAFLLYLERITWPTISMGWALSISQQGLAALERVNRVFDDKPFVVSHSKQTHLPALTQVHIQVNNLSFAYDNPYHQDQSDSAPPVLSHISFEILAGQLVVLVGPVGSGKSTLLQLLARLYPAPPQTIFYNGSPIEDYSLEALRSHVQFMPQNSLLFSASVEENLIYGKPDTPLEKTQTVAQWTQLHTDILQLPNQYQTMVGERGVTLSGGQRQRSALTRTLLMKPDVLLLDDPFASVDVHTENAIIQAMLARHILHQKTTLVATHRMALARHAQQIMVLNTQGKIEAMGSPDEVMAHCALFQALCRQEEEEHQQALEEESA